MWEARGEELTGLANNTQIQGDQSAAFWHKWTAQKKCQQSAMNWNALENRLNFYWLEESVVEEYLEELATFWVV